MKRMLLVVNPKSGKNQIKPYLCDIIDLYVASGYEVTVHTTQYKKDAYEVVRDRGDGYDLIVCSGGDGTLDEVGGGVLELKNAPDLGYIPAGTTNDFAKSLGISSSPMQAAKIAIEGVPFACDLGKFNGTPFIYVAAFGAFTEVSYTTRQEVKNIFGHAAYVLEGIKSLANVKSYHVRCEYGDKFLEDELIYGMVTNSISVGGFKSVSGKIMELNDGLMEVLFVKMPKNLLELQSIVTSLLLQNIDERYMYLIKTNKITISSEEEIAWTLDGEDGGQWQSAEIVNLKQAIRILRPKEAVDNDLEDKTKSASVAKIEEKVEVAITENSAPEDELIDSKKDNLDESHGKAED